MILNYEGFEYTPDSEDLLNALTEIIIDDRLHEAMKNNLYITKETEGILKFYIRSILENIGEKEFENWCRDFEGELEDFFRDDAMTMKNSQTLEEIENDAWYEAHRM